MDPKREKIIATKERKMYRGCICIEIEREKLRRYVDREFLDSKPKTILQFYEDLDPDYYCQLILDCKCFDKNRPDNYVNPTTQRNIFLD